MLRVVQSLDSRPKLLYFKNQCRKETNPTYNDSEIEWWISRLTQNRLKIQIQSRYMPDRPLSDIDFKNKMAWVWTTLKISCSLHFRLLSGVWPKMWTSLISLLLIMYLNSNFAEPLCCPVYFQWDISGMIAIMTLPDVLMLLYNLHSPRLKKL